MFVPIVDLHWLILSPRCDSLRGVCGFVSSQSRPFHPLSLARRSVLPAWQVLVLAAEQGANQSCPSAAASVCLALAQCMRAGSPPCCPWGCALDGSAAASCWVEAIWQLCQSQQSTEGAQRPPENSRAKAKG